MIVCWVRAWFPEPFLPYHLAFVIGYLFSIIYISFLRPRTLNHLRSGAYIYYKPLRAIFRHFNPPPEDFTPSSQNSPYGAVRESQGHSGNTLSVWKDSCTECGIRSRVPFSGYFLLLTYGEPTGRVRIRRQPVGSPFFWCRKLNWLFVNNAENKLWLLIDFERFDRIIVYFGLISPGWRIFWWEMWQGLFDRSFLLWYILTRKRVLPIDG